MRVNTDHWDPKASTADFDKKLEALGHEGWELTGEIPISRDGDTRAFHLFFKRPLPPQD